MIDFILISLFIIAIVLVFLFFTVIYFIIKRKREGKSIKFLLIGLLVTLVVSVGLAVGVGFFVNSLPKLGDTIIEVLTTDEYDLNITEPNSREAQVTVNDVVGLWQLTPQSQEDLGVNVDDDYLLIYENGWLDSVYYHNPTKRQWKIRNGNYIAKKIDGSIVMHKGDLSIVMYSWGKHLKYYYEKVSDVPKRKKLRRKSLKKLGEENEK